MATPLLAPQETRWLLQSQVHNYNIGPTNWDYKEVSVINSLRGDAITRIVYGRTDGQTEASQSDPYVYMHCDLDLGDMTLGQSHDTPLGHVQQLCEILSRSNLTVRIYGPGTDFQYVCTVTLTLEIWPWVKVMTHPLVMDNNCVKNYPDPIWQWGVIAQTRISSMCALWPWPWRYDLGSRSWHTLGSWTTIVWNYIQIGQGSRKLRPGHDVNRRTDRQTGWFLYTPPQTLFAGGGGGGGGVNNEILR